MLSRGGGGDLSVVPVVGIWDLDFDVTGDRQDRESQNSIQSPHKFTMVGRIGSYDLGGVQVMVKE